MAAPGEVASADLQCAIGGVDEFFDGVFAPLESWLPELVEQLRRARAAGFLTGAQSAALVEPGAHRVLDSVGRPIYGAGYCASELVVDEGNPLAWWQGAERSLLASSTFGPGQAAIDLVRLEWYRVPEETGRLHVAGPFVDYLCSNEVTITSALPVMVDSEFWGVICADVLVSALESALLPSLAGLPGVTLANANGRVVLSSDPDLETGDRLPGGGAVAGSGSGPGAGPTTVHSARYPFSLTLPAGVEG